MPKAPRSYKKRIANRKNAPVKKRAVPKKSAKAKRTYIKDGKGTTYRDLDNKQQSALLARVRKAKRAGMNTNGLLYASSSPKKVNAAVNKFMAKKSSAAGTKQKKRGTTKTKRVH